MDAQPILASIARESVELVGQPHVLAVDEGIERHPFAYPHDDAALLEAVVEANGQREEYQAQEQEQDIPTAPKDAPAKVSTSDTEMAVR